MEVITMSSKGQLVIPRSIREEMGLDQRDKFVLVYDKNDIMLRKIDCDELKARMINLMDKFADKFKKAGISREEIEKEIRNARNKSSG